MKKLLIILILFFMTNLQAYADDMQEARAFFNRYISAANNYNTALERMYSPNAVIIRQVIKPNGQLVNVYGDAKTYIKQLRISESIAKVRNYKNYYSNINITQVPKGYKITAIRQPGGDPNKLKMYLIIAEQPNGKWLIIEEMMQTKQQIFLNYAKK